LLGCVTRITEVKIMSPSAAIDPNAIRDRAYARWQARGCPVGSAEHDWLEAERELARERRDSVESAAAEQAPPSSSAPSSKPPRPTLKREPVARPAKPAPKHAGGKSAAR
jgi:hypothetical protein